MYLLTKIFDQMAQPLNWVVGLLMLNGMLRRKNTQSGGTLVTSALALLVLIGFQPLPDAGIRLLESRYPEMAPHADLRAYNGIIVLGGALEPGYLSAGHAQPALNGAAERMTAAVALWQERHALQILFTGGEGDYFGEGPSEAERAQAFFDSQGLPGDAVRYEDQSHNTYENATFSAKLPGMDPQKPWLLVTSAWHMPRAMATFRNAGWNVQAYPVDFRTSAATPWSRYSISAGADRWYLLLHEWLGLASYRLLGRG